MIFSIFVVLAAITTINFIFYLFIFVCPGFPKTTFTSQTNCKFRGTKVKNKDKPFTKNIFLSLPPRRPHESESESRSVLSDSLQPHGLYSPWNSPGRNTGVDSLFLLQGIFPTQGLNLGLPHCRQILYQLSHQGKS